MNEPTVTEVGWNERELPPLRATRKPFDCQFAFDIQIHRVDEFASDTESRRSHRDRREADETVFSLPASHSLDELAELDMRETPGKRFWEQVDNYSRLSISKIHGENTANRSHRPTIAPIVLRGNQVPSA